MNEPMCPDHRFEEFEKHAVGFWQKRECPGDGIYIPGIVQICHTCGVLRLVPDDPNYYSVIVTH